MKRKQFPIGQASEAAETEEFINTVIAQAMPQLRYHAKCIDSASKFNLKLGIDYWLQIQQWIWDDLHLMWMGLGPGHREEFENKLVPLWRDWNSLRERNQAKAKTLIAKRQANGC